MNGDQESNTGIVSGAGVVGRYFLRRLALAHRKSNKPRVQYANALAETIFVFVGLPIAGFTCFVLVINAKRAPAPILDVLGVALQGGQLFFGVVAMLVGYLLLNKRMKKYVDESPTCYLPFSSDKDARIVFWQRIGALIAFGIVPTFLAIAVLALH